MPNLLNAMAQSRVAIIDGAMGTMIQRHRLNEDDFRGERFRDHPRSLRGCSDLLVLTQPNVIAEIHEQYILAGADILETNTFNATRISLADYGLETHVYEINRTAAELVRRAIKNSKTTRPVFVAGSIGPTNKTASISPQVNNPAFRAVNFDVLARAYHEQVRGLLDGGVDVLLAETVFDTLNLKAALSAIDAVFAEKQMRVPVMVSVTVTDQSGRTLSGQTLHAFYVSIGHLPLFSVGLNCALGPAPMRPYVDPTSAFCSVVACNFNGLRKRQGTTFVFRKERGWMQ